MDVVEGGADSVQVKGVLDSGLSSEDGWTVVQMRIQRFLGVGRKEEEAAAWAKAG